MRKRKWFFSAVLALTLALLVTLAPAQGGTAKAANADTLYIAGKEGSGSQFRLLLLDGATLAPLCGAWSS